MGTEERRQKKYQIKQIQSKVHVAIRKIKGSGNVQYTAEQLLQPGKIESLVKLDEGYKVLKNIRSSPPYWEKAKKDLFAMIRQLGLPTFFASFSAAETRWIPLLRALAKLVDNTEYSDEELKNLN